MCGEGDRAGTTAGRAAFRDRFEDALRELIEEKLKGRTVAAKPVTPTAPVVDLMSALPGRWHRLGGGGARQQGEPNRCDCQLAR